MRKMQLYPDEGIRPDPATYPHGDSFPDPGGRRKMAARDARQASAPHFSAGNRTGRAVRFGWLSIRWKTPTSREEAP
ncbi:MAG: hypothetical protein CW346_05535 [Bacillaceae bacterium]|nr:hypothetical protein [Bacillaceae bacterium]